MRRQDSKEGAFGGDTLMIGLKGTYVRVNKCSYIFHDDIVCGDAI